MKKRIFASLLAVSMLVGSLAACSNPGSQDSSGSSTSSAESSEPTVETRDINGLTLPICEDKQEISVLLVYDGNVVDNLNDIAGVQAMEEATNVHVNWTTYTQAEMPERFQQLLATGEYFDIMFPGGVESYPGGYEQGIEDGVLIDMDSHIQEYMPNYLSLLNSNEEAMKQAKSTDGKLHAVRVIKGTDEIVQGPGAIMGPAYRADILEEMDEDVPETVEELHQLLIKCRDRGMSAPMTLQNDGGTTLSLAWGINTDWSTHYWQYDTETQTVVYPPFAENWDDYLDTMRDWYAEGLIDKNFTVGSPLLSGDYSNFENDQSLFIDTWFSTVMGSELYTQGFISNEKVDVKPIAGIVRNKGDKIVKCSWDALLGQTVFVTTQAEDRIDIISKWLDYWYTPEAIKYKYYGIEGESYTIGNGGSIEFTDQILNNPDGLSISDALSRFALRSYFGYQSSTGENSVPIAAAKNGSVPMIEAVEVWASPEVTIHMPEATLNAEESEYVNKYMTDITTLMQERMVKYIMGTDTESHDAFREKLKSHNIEECTKRYQDAVDRYNAK